MGNFKTTFLLHSSENGNRKLGWKYIFLSVLLSCSYYFHLFFFLCCWHFLYKININYLSFHWVFSSHLCLISRINKNKSVLHVLLNLLRWSWYKDKSVVKRLSTQDLIYTGFVVILVWTGHNALLDTRLLFLSQGLLESAVYEGTCMKQLWWHLKSSQAFMTSVSL